MQLTHQSDRCDKIPVLKSKAKAIHKQPKIYDEKQQQPTFEWTKSNRDQKNMENLMRQHE